MAHTLEALEHVIPPSVLSMVARKLEPLSESDRELLVAAAVQGDVFDAAVLAAVAALDPEDVERRLEPIERLRGIIRLVGEEDLPDGTLTARYRFGHALYQHALYSSLRPAGRARLSQKTAAALLQLHATRADRVAGYVALLFEAAREFMNASEHFLTASRMAARRGAHMEAVALARRGLAAVKRLPAGEPRNRRELDLQLALVMPLSADRTHAAEDVAAVFARAACTLCEALQSDAELFGVMVGAVWSDLTAGRIRQARADAESCLQIAGRLPGSAYQLEAHFVLGAAHARLGEASSACDHLRRSLALYDAADHAHLAALFGSDPGVHARAELAFVLHYMGRFTEAHAIADEAIAMGRAHGHPLTLSLALMLALNVHLRSGRHAAGVTMLGELQGLLDQYPSAHVMWLPFFAAWVDVAGGIVNDGTVARMQASVDALRSAGTLYSLPSIRAHIAAVHLRLGALDQALGVVDVAHAEAETIGERYLLGELLRLRGAILTRQRSLDASEAAFQEAIATSRSQGLRLWELRAAIDLVPLLRDRGRVEEARLLLGETLEQFSDERDDVKDLRMLRSLLVA